MKDQGKVRKTTGLYKYKMIYVNKLYLLLGWRQELQYELWRCDVKKNRKRSLKFLNFGYVFHRITLINRSYRSIYVVCI